MGETHIPPLSVTGVEVFGDDEKVEVLRFAPNPELDILRANFEPFHKSQYKEFKPHLTLGPKGSTVYSTLPKVVEFDRLSLVFGNKKFTTYF